MDVYKKKNTESGGEGTVHHEYLYIPVQFHKFCLSGEKAPFSMPAYKQLDILACGVAVL